MNPRPEMAICTRRERLALLKVDVVRAEERKLLLAGLYRTQATLAGKKLHAAELELKDVQGGAGLVAVDIVHGQDLSRNCSMNANLNVLHDVCGLQIALAVDQHRLADQSQLGAGRKLRHLRIGRYPTRRVRVRQPGLTN